MRVYVTTPAGELVLVHDVGSGDGESVWLGSYDGDPSGGDGSRAVIYEIGCAEPYAGEDSSGGLSNVSPGQELVHCGGAAYRQKVCP